MMKRNVIAIDLGATSGRVILSSLDEDRGLEMETVHRFPIRLLNQGGKYYWDLYDIRNNILEGQKIISRRTKQMLQAMSRSSPYAASSFPLWAAPHSCFGHG